MNEAAFKKGKEAELAKKAKLDRFNQESDRKQEFYKEHVLKPKEEILQRRDREIEK